ncbi:MAG: PAS domain-containing protein [Planctomycetes bacterium]|nr:PAS domain-containing protein [Planctomycetota bacterium]
MRVLEPSPEPPRSPPGVVPSLRSGEGCERIAELYERSPVAHVLVTEDALVVELNLAAAALLDVERERAAGRPLPALARLDRAALLRRLRACARDEAPQAVELDLTSRAGAERRVLLDARRVPDPGTDARLFLLAMTDVTGRRPPDEALEAVLEAAGATAGVLEADALVERLTCAAVPLLADLAIVDLLHEGGLRRRVVLRHVDPSRAERVRALEERWGLLPNVAFSSLQALQTGRPQLLPPVAPAYLEAAAVDAEHLTELVGLVLRSWAVAPLIAPETGAALGVLRLATSGVRRPFDPQDVALAGRIGQLGGAGLAAARAHAAARAADAARAARAIEQARALEEALRSLLRARGGLGGASALGADLGRAVERVRAVSRELGAV